MESPLIFIRGEYVMLDSDLAEFFGVQTKMINRAVKRNQSRFSPELMFQLTKEEFGSLNFSKQLNHQCQQGSNNIRRGGRRYLPFVFKLKACLIVLSLMRSKKINYKEKSVENFIASNMDAIRSGLNLEKVQYRIGKNHRPDILAYDKNNFPVILEIQIGSLNRGHLYRSLEYRDLFFLKEGILPKVILVAEGISQEYKQILNIHEIEYFEFKSVIPFPEISKEVDHNFIAERINSMFQK